ncbi:MAG: hypothetical protein JNM66_17790 [Bryobacterales bacterium]|nr:hypothetical protein [Bryobacterales bacterium]
MRGWADGRPDECAGTGRSMECATGRVRVAAAGSRIGAFVARLGRWAAGHGRGDKTFDGVRDRAGAWPGGGVAPKSGVVRGRADARRFNWAWHRGVRCGAGPVGGRARTWGQDV